MSRKSLAAEKRWNDLFDFSQDGKDVLEYESTLSRRVLSGMYKSLSDISTPSPAFKEKLTEKLVSILETYGHTFQGEEPIISMFKIAASPAFDPDHSYVLAHKLIRHAEEKPHIGAANDYLIAGLRLAELPEPVKTTPELAQALLHSVHDVKKPFVLRPDLMSQVNEGNKAELTDLLLEEIKRIGKGDDFRSRYNAHLHNYLLPLAISPERQDEILDQAFVQMAKPHPLRCDENVQNTYHFLQKLQDQKYIDQGTADYAWQKKIDIGFSYDDYTNLPGSSGIYMTYNSVLAQGLLNPNAAFRNENAITHMLTDPDPHRYGLNVCFNQNDHLAKTQIPYTRKNAKKLFDNIKDIAAKNLSNDNLPLESRESYAQTLFEHGKQSHKKAVVAFYGNHFDNIRSDKVINFLTYNAEDNKETSPALKKQMNSILKAHKDHPDIAVYMRRQDIRKKMAVLGL